MKRKKKDVFDFEYFDEEEKELIESIEGAIDRGELKSVMTPELKKHYEEVARYSIKMRKLEQSKSKKKDIPLQTTAP